jgi:hypothetical protein
MNIIFNVVLSFLANRPATFSQKSGSLKWILVGEWIQI